MFFKDFPNRLKKLRKVKDLSQRDLATLANISPSYVASLETGAADPTLRVVKKLSKALNVNMEFFLEKDNAIPLINYAEHFPTEIQSFLMEEESLAYITMIKEFADKKIPPEDLREIVNLILKHKEGNVK